MSLFKPLTQPGSPANQTHSGKQQ